MTSTLLEWKDAAVRVPGRIAPLLLDVNLRVLEGEVLHVVGESGAGKSTLLKSLVGAGFTLEGDLLFRGKSVRSRGVQHELRRQTGVIPQAARTALSPHLSALDAVAEAVKAFQGKQRTAARELAGELLEKTGLAPSRWSNRPGELSGGECQRVHVARVLAKRARLILADEPTASLDASSAREVLDLVLKAARESGATLVHVTHDLRAVENGKGRIVVLLEGLIQEICSQSRGLESLLHPYSRYLVEASTGPVPSRPPVEDGCPFAGICSKVTDECRIGLVPMTRAGASSGQGGDSAELHVLRCRAFRQ